MNNDQLKAAITLFGNLPTATIHDVMLALRNRRYDIVNSNLTCNIKDQWRNDILETEQSIKRVFDAKVNSEASFKELVNKVSL